MVRTKMLYFVSAAPIDASAALKDSKQPAVGTVAGDFQLSNLQGKKIKLSDQLKNGPVVLLVLRGYPGYQCPLCTRQVSQFINSAPKFKAAKASVKYTTTTTKCIKIPLQQTYQKQNSFA